MHVKHLKSVFKILAFQIPHLWVEDHDSL